MNLNNLNSLKLKLPHLAYGPRIHPSRDWMLILALSLVLFISFALWGGWVFLSGSTAPAAPVPANTKSALSPELLRETDALFEKRAQEEARYRGEYLFIDPALPGS